MGTDTITVIDNTNGKRIELPIIRGTDGPATVDIRDLSAKLGYFTYDPGFMSTASCRSQITYIDGNEGILRYRGIPIEQLAEKSTFLETCYLLFYGELPNQEQLTSFARRLRQHNLLQEGMRPFYSGFRQDAHPMAIMVGVVGALSAFYHETTNVHNPKHREKATLRLIAKMPTIAAWSYKYNIGQPFIYPDDNLGYTENFLRMMFALPTAPYQVNPTMVRALDLILILHADHEQNASTSTVRLCGSSEANPYAAMSAGIASLWGPAHGGANEAVIRMLMEISRGGGDVKQYVERAKDKNSKTRLMGFGHRVYKNYDPRAKIIRKMCHELLTELGAVDSPLFQIAMELEKIALEDSYFIERKLYPNVDFYSGIILRAMGIPMSMFTVIFALARTVGWMSHWNEMMGDPESRIGRPRQVYSGHVVRDYVPMEQRDGTA